jgi:Predicted transcriptional regulator
VRRLYRSKQEKIDLILEYLWANCHGNRKMTRLQIARALGYEAVANILEPLTTLQAAGLVQAYSQKRPQGIPRILYAPTSEGWQIWEKEGRNMPGEQGD